jgi:hypothetical protein
MSLTRYRSLPEAEGRVLLLINAFSGSEVRPRALEGRVKLAKLDFLVRYPKYLARVLAARNVPAERLAELRTDESPLEDRMLRFRYGPWDPSYYAVLGSLIGRGLVAATPVPRGIGYRTTDRGRALARDLVADDAWMETSDRVNLVRRHLDKTGTFLMKLLYESVPEMTSTTWWEEVE